MRPFIALSLAGLILFVLLSTLYNRSQTIDFEEHRQYENSLLAFSALDATLNQELLKARYRLIENYDGFEETAAEMRIRLARMQTVPRFVSPPVQQELHLHADRLVKELERKLELIERFESQNAVFNNSLTYFPPASSDLIERLEAQVDDTLAEPFTDLTLGILIYLLRGQDEPAPDFQSEMASIARWRSEHPDNAEAALVSSLSAHGAKLLQLKPRIEALTREILAVPSARENAELLRSYHGEVESRLRSGNSYRRNLYLLSALFCLGVGGAIFALFKANRRLEQRVSERTCALSSKKDELEREIWERRRTEQALRSSEQRFRELAENIQDVFWMTTQDMQEVLYVSPAFEKIWGLPPEVLQTRPLSWTEAIHEEDRERVFAAFAQLRSDHPAVSVEYRIHHTNGELRWVADRGFVIPNSEGEPYRIVGVARDITERKRLEAELIEANKLQMIGRLAGGIAHDFNTLLTAIIGHAELIRDAAAPESEAGQSAAQISQSANRAATLTHQLLAFSRKQVLQSELVDLNKILVEIEPMVRRLVGERVAVSILGKASQASTKADASQIQQVLVQLAVNARDAMPKGGQLTLETADCHFDEVYAAARAEVKPGQYVMIAVTDTGTGIPEPARAHLFEPFFTTKPQGQGTGLGLAMCYGIVKQIGGHISFYTEPGHGTTFKIYLPRAAAKSTPLPVAKPRLPSAIPAGVKQTILLVEDDAGLRELATAVLTRLGYTVQPAANGVEALSLFEHTARIDLLLTDLVMPEMGGQELAARFIASHDGAQVLFTSAYTREAIVHHGFLSSEADYLSKPYTPSALVTKVREALERPEAPLGGEPQTVGATRSRPL